MDPSRTEAHSETLERVYRQSQQTCQRDVAQVIPADKVAVGVPEQMRVPGVGVLLRLPVDEARRTNETHSPSLDQQNERAPLAKVLLFVIVVIVGGIGNGLKVQSRLGEVRWGREHVL